MLKKFKVLLLWTVGYTTFTTVFFRVLFGFNIWYGQAWRTIASSTISGIAGLAFGASIIIAFPVYFVMAVYIYKNQKMPIKAPKIPKFPIKLPKFLRKKEAPKEESNPSDGLSSPKLSLPDELPDELRVPYIKTKTGELSKNAIDFIKTGKKEPVKTAEVPADNFMPVPESFDTEEPKKSVPLFREINFDKNDKSLKITKKGKKKIATYVFDDPSIWIAEDEDNWFAEGKQIKSPVAKLLSLKADERILILEKTNIINIDHLSQEWEKKGITVVIKS